MCTETVESAIHSQEVLAVESRGLWRQNLLPFRGPQSVHPVFISLGESCGENMKYPILDQKLSSQLLALIW